MRQFSGTETTGADIMDETGEFNSIPSDIALFRKSEAVAIPIIWSFCLISNAGLCFLFKRLTASDIV